MAYDLASVNAVRSAFIHNRQSLAKAAAAAGVPETTARRWKRSAKANGDDWDAARNVTGKAMRQRDMSRMVDLLYDLQQSVMAEIAESGDLTAERKAQLLTQLGDSFAKVSNVAKGLFVATPTPQIALAVLTELGAYLASTRPDLAPAFLEVLEPFTAHMLRKLDARV